MNGDNKINNYIELLSKTDFGILSVDIGRLKNEHGEWHQDTGFCAEIAKGIHEEISILYKDIVGQEPVNFLFEHFNSGLETINKDYYVYAFKVNSNSFEIDKKHASLDVSAKELSLDLVRDIRGVGIENYDPLGNQSVRETIKKKFFDGLKTELTLEINAKEKFKVSQQAFTNAVGYAYYKKGLSLKFVTIILLTYKRDNCSIFSNSIVLFSSRPLTKVDSSIDGTDEGTIDDPILQLIFENIRGDKYLDRIEELGEKIKNEAQKSAKAAIMSRNMSHNIGSHVMSYLKQHLGSVKDIVADGILSDLINGESELVKKLENTTENTTLPFLMGLGHFISYIQERQDFIATIATDYIPYFGNINFKDTIYDELNPDKRAERHTERKNGKTDNILLGNIARSEGLGRNHQSTSKRSGQLADIVLNFQDSNNNVFDGNPVVNKDNSIAGRENARKALEEMRKWEVSVPGGVIGRQAIFSIVENLVRNTAKHGNWRDQGKLELTFNYFTKDSLTEEFCDLKEREADILRRNTDQDGKLKKLSKKDEDELNNIRKGLEQWNEDAAPTEKPHFWGEDKGKHNSLMEVLWYFYGQSLDADDLYFVTITDNVNISERAVDKLRTALVEDYIDNESKMIEGNKGIKEIRISAAWLRGAKNEDEYYNSGAKLIDPQTWKKAPLVYVRQHCGCLQYIICLQKPRKLAIVSWRSLSIESEKSFKNLNCRYYTPETYRKEKNKSFDFILFDDSDKPEKEEYCYDALKPISSSRFWKLSDIEELAKKNDKEEPELFVKLQNVTEEKLNDILLLLYKKLSHYEADDSIWIDDKTAAANVCRDTDGATPKYTKSNYITVQDGISKGVHKYIYRTHHDSEKEYSNYIDAVNAGTIDGNIFVEGISGNNSTDRLVRNEKLDDIWFYKHLHAMKEQVAVFDERLFTKIFGIEESHLKDEGTFKIDDSNRDLYRERYYEEIINSNDEQYSSFVDNNTQEEQDRILLENFKNETSPNTSKEYADAQSGIKPIVYQQKGVYIFTLIQDPNPDKQNVFNLYGLSEKSSNTKAICKKIASLTWSQANGLEFNGEITNKDDYYINKYKRFDRISIHQGLLDKLYEVFGIKDQQKEKERLTKQFHQAFSSSVVVKTKSAEENAKKANEKNKLSFLTGFCIHSGRSKPSQIDMPQKLPFIQYASIENAVLDCKYSLVELLDFARYE